MRAEMVSPSPSPFPPPFALSAHLRPPRLLPHPTSARARAVTSTTVILWSGFYTHFLNAYRELLREEQPWLAVHLFAAGLRRKYSRPRGRLVVLSFSYDCCATVSLLACSCIRMLSALLVQFPALLQSYYTKCLATNLSSLSDQVAGSVRSSSSRTEIAIDGAISSSSAMLSLSATQKVSQDLHPQTLASPTVNHNAQIHCRTERSTSRDSPMSPCPLKARCPLAPGPRQSGHL